MAFDGKPILGIVGGIGSGKSFVSRAFAAQGCCVIDADAAAHAVYADPHVRATLRAWYGDAIFNGDLLDRRAVARRVFGSVAERERLEALIHPLVHAQRRAEMNARRGDATVRAFVWDTPLLIEVGLDAECDGIVFVDTPVEVRQRRVQQSRGWDAGELARREANQFPLNQKRARATWVLPGDADEATLKTAVARVIDEALLLRLPRSRGRGPG